jgi:hypothetical protein
MAYNAMNPPPAPEPDKPPPVVIVKKQRVHRVPVTRPEEPKPEPKTVRVIMPTKDGFRTRTCTSGGIFNKTWGCDS